MTAVAVTAKAWDPRQVVDLHRYGPCTAASCAGLFLEYFELAFIYMTASSVAFQIRLKRLSYSN